MVIIMKTAVRYYSRGGSTKKLAEAIASAVSAPSATVEEPLSEPVDLLFIGSAIYAGKVNERMRDFLNSLTSETVKKAAVFSTAMGPVSAHGQIKELLSAKGIFVYDEYFHCQGKFLVMNRRRPNEQDCAEAGAFAEKITEKETDMPE